MPTLDELLNASNEVATCTVNPDTREIIVPEKYKILGVFSDEKVTKIPFTCPKVVGNNVDLTEYNLYINYQNARGRHNAYFIDDVVVSGDNITFSWLLSRDVTLSSGVVKYSLCAKKLNGDSISNEWNTTIANGVVIQGLEATQAIIEENSDIIETILSKAHTHVNKSVLDKFAETDGKPTYDGKALGGGASTSEGVSYTNAQLPNAANVKTALDELVPKSHSHANKDSLDKLSVSNGKLQYNGSDVGLKGDKGTDGTTPHIGNNGNWYLGTTDTGKPSRGERGDPGKNGSDASVTEANIIGALGYKPAAPGDIPVVPTAAISANTSARHSHTNKNVLDSITAVDTAMSDASTNPVQNKVIKKYIDDHSSGTGGTGGTANAVLYTAQTLDLEQQGQARTNIGAVGINSPQFHGFLALAPANAPLGSGVGLSPTGSGHNYTLDISDVNENTPTLLTGVKTPTDSDTNAAATVEYVKTKIASSGGGGGSSSNILTSPVMICKPGEEGNAGIYLSTIGTGEKQAEIKFEDANENSAVAIANLRTPTGANASDYAATKGYVDSKVPTALKNPNALTIKIGSTTVTYDGSTAQTVTIADGSEVALLMAKKLYEEASVQDIAAAIREKTGGAETYKIAQMGNAVRGITGAEAVTWHQCPEAVRNYLSSVTYDPSDYSTSQIANYAPAAAVQSNTKPIGKAVDGKTFYNEPPNALTPFATTHKAGTLKPLDQVRWINTSQTPNVRDVGGWACDGGTVKYGKIFRGGEPTQADVTLLTGEVGIRAELELQGTEGGNSNALAGKVDYCCPLNGAYWAYYGEILKNKAQVKEALNFVIDAACHGKPIYIHCSAGADRTGTVICIIEGILGVDQSDCDKDYELTSFAGNGDSSYLRKRCGRTVEETGTVAEAGYKQFISGIVALPGATFRDKCVNFVLSCGITAEQINAFRAAMIDGTPETLSPTVSSYTVSRSLSGATADNSAASATQYQPYETKIEPEDGKVISSVKVTMGGVDITSAVFSGQRTNMRHAVTMSLKHCAIDNHKKAVIDGEGYGATITAAAGYTLDGAAVTITMGGTDVSTYYSNGKIAIPSVTGDIAITVTAVSSAPTYTNLFDASKMHAGQRINSGGQLEANSAWNVSNDISYVAGSTSTVRIKGIGDPAVSDARVCYSTNNGESWYAAIHIKSTDNYTYDASADIISFTLKTPNPNMFRVSFPSTVNVDGLVITLNEPID